MGHISSLPRWRFTESLGGPRVIYCCLSKGSRWCSVTTALTQIKVEKRTYSEKPIWLSGPLPTSNCENPFLFRQPFKWLTLSLYECTVINWWNASHCTRKWAQIFPLNQMRRVQMSVSEMLSNLSKVTPLKGVKLRFDPRQSDSHTCVYTSPIKSLVDISIPSSQLTRHRRDQNRAKK